jgi:predicted aspartyl protease
MLESVAAGGLQFGEVAASANDAAIAESLPGMNSLDRRSGYEVRGDSLILRP